MSEVPGEEQERLARDLAEELRKLRVEDVLVNTLMHVSSIGYRRLGVTVDTVEERDLDQVRLAIETMRALTPVLERFVPGELVRDFNSSVANLQLAYAKAATEARPAPADAPPGEGADAGATSAEAEPGGQSPGRGPEGQEAAVGGESGSAGESPGRGVEEHDDVAPSDVSGGQSPGHGEDGQGGGEAQA